MPKSIEEIRSMLSVIEPDDSMYQQFDLSDISNLRALLGDDESWLVARAVHALARLDSAEARQAVSDASFDRRPEIRIAAARASEFCPADVADQILGSLLADVDTGVRKFAIRSSSSRNGEAIKRPLREIANADDNLTLRHLAAEKVKLLAPN
jgi:hypothetical protein